MFRSIPCSNKICFDKQLKRNWKIHQQKLTRMRSKLSKQRSEEFTFLDQSKKRNVLKDIKNRQIQRSNHILFKKIQEIERKGCKNSYIKIDKQKDVVTQRLLHQPFRKRQLVRIVEQNQDLMKRIKDKKSAYNVKRMEQDRKDIQKNINLISQFKYKNYPVSQTQCNFYMIDQRSRLSGSGSRVTNRQETRRQVSQFDDFSEPRCKTTLKKHHRNQNTNRFNQKTKIINEKHYIVTTYTSKETFFVQVENLQNNLEKYRMQMTQAQLKKLLPKYYQNSVDVLIDNLDIDLESQSCYLKFQKCSSPIRTKESSISRQKRQSGNKQNWN